MSQNYLLHWSSYPSGADGDQVLPEIVKLLTVNNLNYATKDKCVQARHLHTI